MVRAPLHAKMIFCGLVPTAVLLTNTLIRDYLLNYARPLIYTTSLNNATIIAVSCSFDLLEDGTAEGVRVHILFFVIRTLVCLSSDEICPFNSSRRKFLSIRYTFRSSFVHPSPHRLSLRTSLACQPTFKNTINPRWRNRRHQSYRF